MMLRLCNHGPRVDEVDAICYAHFLVMQVLAFWVAVQAMRSIGSTVRGSRAMTRSAVENTAVDILKG